MGLSLNCSLSCTSAVYRLARTPTFFYSLHYYPFLPKNVPRAFAACTSLAHKQLTLPPSLFLHISLVYLFLLFFGSYRKNLQDTGSDFNASVYNFCKYTFKCDPMWSCSLPSLQYSSERSDGHCATVHQKKRFPQSLTKRNEGSLFIFAFLIIITLVFPILGGSPLLIDHPSLSLSLPHVFSNSTRRTPLPGGSPIAG